MKKAIHYSGLASLTTCFVVIVSLFLAVGFCPSETNAKPFDYLRQWGSYGSGDGQLHNPLDIAVDSGDKVHVVDYNNSRNQKFDSAGTPLGCYGRFHLHWGIAVDSDDNIYVAEGELFSHRIQKFDSSGSYLGEWGSEGSGDGQFEMASGVAVDSAGNVYVADNNNHRIQKFDSAGAYLGQWGSRGSGDGQFEHPFDVAVDSVGNVYVADAHNHRIQVFDNLGTYLGQWGSHGSGDGQFKAPFKVAVDSGGNIYVADTHNHRIQVFDNLGIYLVQWGSYGSGDGQFDRPMGIAFDSAGNVYVADVENHRIQVFEGFPTQNPPEANAGSNLSIASESQETTIICGTGSDPDDDPLTFRWLEGMAELSSWQALGPNGEACLDLSTVSAFVNGAHTLTLEVSDGHEATSDEMILTVENSAPHAAPFGGGVYEINTEVILEGDVSDFDGDLLNFEWREGEEILYLGQIETIAGGTPVPLPSGGISTLGLGAHTITLEVDDGINDPVSKDISVEIVDITVPTLSPVPNTTILWPPDHKMTAIEVASNAVDNSGLPVTLAVSVTSNEPVEGLGDGDASPDWLEPVIDQEEGTIYLQLRPERSGSGDGRIYTVTITATDQSENSSTANLEFIVPHDMRKKE